MTTMSPRRCIRLTACVLLPAILPTCRAGTPAFVTSPAASVLVSGGSMMNGDQFADDVLPVMRTHFAGVREVVLVLHSLHPADRDRMEMRLQKAFAHLGGIQAESLHHEDAAGQRARLERAEGIFAAGGETFVLLAELRRTGQLELIRARVLSGVPYAGTSAGANVAGLHIGTTNDFPVTDIPSRASLGIFPAIINPHHPLPEAKADFEARTGKIKAYLRFNPDETVLALGNASIARLHAGRVTLACGAGWVYRSSGVRALAPGDYLPELATGAGP
jgi:dipeptidase E